MHMEAFLILPKICEGIDGKIRVLQLFGAWIMCTDTPQKYRAAVTSFISLLYINFKHLILFSDHSLGSIKVTGYPLNNFIGAYFVALIIAALKSKKCYTISRMVLCKLS